MKCFIDLAGVLTDWAYAVCKHYDIPYSYSDFPFTIGEWEWVTPYAASSGLNREEFMAPFGYDFYATLPWTSDGKDILGCIMEQVGVNNLYILTTPIEVRGCMDGALEWVRREIPVLKDRVVFTSLKGLLATKHSLLIDDKDENIFSFIKAGGGGIIVPRPWNKRHKEAHQTVECLRKDLHWVFKMIIEEEMR